jgi:hypothetical protein
MENEDKTLTIRGVSPPRDTFTLVMNGVGNWTMIGTLPFIVGESLAALRGKPLSKAMIKGNLALLAGSSVVGAYFGLKEARELTSYRAALAQELAELHNKSAGKGS